MGGADFILISTSLPVVWFLRIDIVAGTAGRLYPFLKKFTTNSSECEVTPRMEDIFGNNHVLRATLPSSITQFVPEMRTAPTPVAHAVVASKCAKWVEAATDIVRTNCGKVLRHVPNVAGLADIRNEVWDVLKVEYAEIAKVLPQRSMFSDTGDDVPETALKQLCTIIGESVSRFEPWSRMLQPVLSERAQAVLSGMFRVTIEDAQSTMQLEAAGEDAVENTGVGDLASALWSGASPLPTDFTRHRGTQGWDSLPFVKLLSQYTGGYTPEVMGVVENLSGHLEKILEDAQCFLGNEEEGQRGRGGASVGLRSPNSSLLFDESDAEEPPFDKDSDSAETRRFLQAACEKFVVDLVAWIGTQRDALGADGDEDDAVHGARVHGARQVTHVLFLGRVCKALADRCTALSKLILLPVDAAAERCVLHACYVLYIEWRRSKSINAEALFLQAVV